MKKQKTRLFDISALQLLKKPVPSALLTSDLPEESSLFPAVGLIITLTGHYHVNCEKTTLDKHGKVFSLSAAEKVWLVDSPELI